jgi:hypothetical protein
LVKILKPIEAALQMMFTCALTVEISKHRIRPATACQL